MMRAKWLLCATLVLLPACAKKEAPFCPAPRVSMAQLADQLPTPASAFMLLGDEESVGRFTAALVIARLGPCGPGADGLQVLEISAQEQAFWSEQMRGVSALREIVYLNPRGTKPEPESPAWLCERAGALGGALLLVYSRSELAPNAAEVLGVLYDVARERPLATLRAAAEFTNDKGVCASPDKEKGDHRDSDARYQAQRAFERNTLACLRELMHADHPPATTQPHNWHQPLSERWWLRPASPGR
jgi:hypothetical protein